MSSKDDVSWFNGLLKYGIKLGVGNIRELLELLGRPQDYVRFIHVSGTDGKGSVCAMLESILIAFGIKTGMFTSPYILDVNECIRLNGKNIPNAVMERLLRFIRPYVKKMADDGKRCTNFEVLTAIALLFFKIQSTDIAIIEVGMGGKTDCTNIIVPEISIINNISIEHKMYLGNTIEEITYEKGGIMKCGVPCVTMNNDYVYSILHNIANSIGCNIFRVNGLDIKVLSSNIDSIKMVYKGSAYSISLPGRYQANNAALAIEAISILYGPKYGQYIKNGLRSVFWPCRMQKIKTMPIIIDVTHTTSGAVHLHNDIKEIYGKVLLVLGMLSDKDIDGVSHELASIADRVFIAEPNSPRAASMYVMEKIMSKYNKNTMRFLNIEKAMDVAIREHGNLNILVTGSFYTARDALKWIQNKSVRS